jgi:hypothetical protein
MIAEASIRAGLPPSAFLDDPELGEAMLGVLAEQAEQERRQGLLDRLRAKTGRR